jgi:peroxiredoxin
MSGKSKTRQQRRTPATQGAQPRGQAPGQHPARPAAPGNGQAPGERPATAAARRKAATAARRKAKPAAARQAQRGTARRRKIAVRATIAAAAAGVVAGLFVIFTGATHSGTGAYPYQVGSPGRGQAAPGFTLAASTGGKISLSQYRGKTVLLFFQEGLTCQPCWNQIADLQHHAAQLKAAGISNVVSITSDPVGAITQKARDMALTIPVLSDPGLAVSQAYRANHYGMMGSSRDGHTFILVGPDGKIRWRADYGGAPKYIMFLPTTSLLADIKAGEHPS